MCAPPPGLAVPKAAAAAQACAQQAAAQAAKPMQARPQPQRMQQVCNASASQLQTGIRMCSCCRTVSQKDACEVSLLVTGICRCAWLPQLLH